LGEPWHPAASGNAERAQSWLSYRGGGRADANSSEEIAERFAQEAKAFKAYAVDYADKFGALQDEIKNGLPLFNPFLQDFPSAVLEEQLARNHLWFNRVADTVLAQKISSP
jgi:hypothetical protein